MLRLKNATAHTVTVLREGRVVAQWLPSGVMARVPEASARAGELLTDQGFVPLHVVEYCDGVEGLAKPRAGEGVIVSRVLAETARRPDLFFPYPEIRDGAGRIIGCGGLARFAPPEPVAE